MARGSAGEGAVALTEPEAIDQFTDLYVRHYRQVYAYAASRAGRQLAEEVVSEVFLVAWRRHADVPAPALPWLLAVARNVVLGQFRAARRQSAAEWHELGWQARDETADVADQVAEVLAVRAALGTLSDADRELLTLVAWQGLRPSQVAQVVGCSTPAVRVRLHRARRRLERAMSRAVGSDPEGASDHSRPSAAVASPQFSGTSQAQPQAARAARHGGEGASSRTTEGTIP